MHNDAKQQLTIYTKDFYVYSKRIPVLPVYENEGKDKLIALHKCIISTQKNLDDNFTKEELAHFISDRVGNKLYEKNKGPEGTEEYEKLVDLLEDSEIEEIISNIDSEISKLPFQYTIYFNLGITNDAFKDIEIQIDEDLYLKGIDRSTLPSEGFKGISPLQAALYGSGRNEIKQGDTLTIELKFSGYVDEFAITPPLEQAVNKVKVFIALCMIFNVLWIDFFKYISFYFQKSVFIFDGDTKFIRTVELEHDLSESLHRLILHKFALTPNGLMLLGRGTQPTVSENFQGKFEFIKNYFVFIKKPAKSKKEKEYAKRLENILSWYLLGISANNKSVGFVSLVFALESLFTIAPTDKGELISSGLAARCAYFISNDFKERESIITDIGNIYKLRSNIAHDGVQITTKEELELFAKLLSLLQFSLNKEIKSIKA